MSQLTIDIKKLRHNIQFLVQYCNRLGLEITGILKGPGLDSVILHELISNGVENIGFSNLPVNKNYDNVFQKKPVFISLPSLHELGDMIQYFGTSFNSELSVLKKMNEVAIARNKTHNIILMVDTGDLREGVLPENVVDTVKRIHEIKKLRLVFSGIGTNLGCCAGIIPTHLNVDILQELATRIETQLSLPVKTVSVGGSVMLEYLKTNPLPEKINQIRLGESIFLGNIPTIDKKHENLYDDVLIFRSDVLETSEKRIDLPENLGKNAFGYNPEFKHTGIRKRAVMNFGIADTYPAGLTPVNVGLDIVCINSNYTVIDFTDSREDLKPGDFIEFKMNYMSMLQSFISPFTCIVFKQQTDE
ncbi:alanine racemase [Desulfobacula toluolica]|uniref:Alanine racemanse n=1 Tax=Desulfobacula toluolica (strain DSM 7467 / Tol2) TaxID=651182 RepID=K0NQ30_DESTT|nr:alanine racemase [Desulfobacula toluolica]CCK80977.1 alanine racemanse [Desulfobacula toluolica Tol2]